MEASEWGCLLKGNGIRIRIHGDEIVVLLGQDRGFLKYKIDLVKRQDLTVENVRNEGVLAVRLNGSPAHTGRIPQPSEFVATKKRPSNSPSRKGKSHLHRTTSGSEYYTENFSTDYSDSEYQASRNRSGFANRSNPMIEKLQRMTLQDAQDLDTTFTADPNGELVANGWH